MSKVVKQLNKIQALSHAFYLAFHDYHWNVKGLQFAPIHAYTESAYDEMGTLFDDMAERALQVGGKAVNKIEDLIELSKGAPVESKGNYKAEEVLKNVRSSYECLIKEFKVLSEVAEEVGDVTTSNIAQDHVSGYEKKIWMLNAMLEG